MIKPDRYLLIGLGNPGLRYKNTRHNMGFMVIDYLAQKYSVSMKKSRCRAYAGEGFIESTKVILAKPQTYMNNSGESVVELMRYYNVGLENIIVIYDDMDIELGKIRIRKKGSSGSHNGMKSIIYHTESQDFIRVRVGIGKSDLVDTIPYVLGRFGKSEYSEAFRGIENAAEGIRQIITSDIETAMGRFN